MILRKMPSQEAMEEVLKGAGYTRGFQRVRLDGARVSHEEAPSKPAVTEWTHLRTGDRVLLVETGGGEFYNWELYLPVGGNTLDGTLAVFAAHLEKLG